MVMFKCVAKSQSVELLAGVTYILSNSIAEIRYFFATSKPSLFLINIFITLLIGLVIIMIYLIRFNLRIDAHFHSKIKQRISFCEVHYIELNGFIFSGVFDLKKEPLSMTISINVILH